MKNKNLYEQAHLIVAAIRVLEHKNTALPLIEDVCEFLSITLEQGNLICKKLRNLQIIDIVEGAFGRRLSITDHLKLEEIPKEEKDTSIKDDIQKFKDSQKNFSKKIESIKAQQKQKQKDLFAEIERKLKKDLT